MKNKLLENFIDLEKLNLKKEYTKTNVFDAYVKVIASGGSIDLIANYFKTSRRIIKKSVKYYIKQNFTIFKNIEELNTYIKKHVTL